jgi:hypothetical protein
MADEMTGNPDELRSAGRDWLPEMASTFKQAGRRLDDLQPISFNRDYGLGTGPYGPWNEWLKLRSTLVDVLLENARSLDDAGVAMWRFADDLQDKDTGAAQRAQQLERRADRGHRRHRGPGTPQQRRSRPLRDDLPAP